MKVVADIGAMAFCASSVMSIDGKPVAPGRPNPRYQQTPEQRDRALRAAEEKRERKRRKRLAELSVSPSKSSGNSQKGENASPETD